MGPARPKSAHWWGKEHARCFLPWRFESSQTHEPGRKVRQVDRACPWQRSFQELWTPLRARPQLRQAELQQLQACCLQRSLDISGSYPRGWGLRSFKALRPIWSLRSIFLEELSQPSTSGSLIVQSLSHVRLCATPWTVAHQAPLSVGFSTQEYWSGVPLPSPISMHKPA